MRAVCATALLPALLALLACGGGPREESETAAVSAGQGAAAPASFPLADCTAEAGVAFTHRNGASPQRLLPETMGSGVAIFDADGDGWPDLFFVDGATPGSLWRNLGGGRGFAAVKPTAGLAGPGGSSLPYGMGAAVGDVDRDGDLDLFVSGVGGHRLRLNRGDGTFDDRTAAWGLTARGFGSSAAFLDFDRDGWLDLFVGRYVTWSPERDLPCLPDGVHRAYCTPEVYPGEESLLYRNRQGEGFEDVSARAGVAALAGKTLGVVVSDLDRDGFPDLALANDTARNFLFWNRGDGTLREGAEEAGFAFSESGATRGGMGIDAGDVDGDGAPDLAVGNFAQEMSALYRQAAPGVFVDEAAPLGVGLPTLPTLAFGTLVADLDGDGWLDVAVANGHIEPEIAAIRRSQTYPQPFQLFANRGGGSFTAVPAGEGGPPPVPLVGRGLAAGDLDRDGDPDLVITQNGRSARLLCNGREGAGPGAGWLRLELLDEAGSPAPYGAAVTATVEGRVLYRYLASGRSYLSASEPVLALGLGPAESADHLLVEWPSGRRRAFRGLPAGYSYRLREPEG